MKCAVIRIIWILTFLNTTVTTLSTTTELSASTSQTTRNVTISSVSSNAPANTEITKMTNNISTSKATTTRKTLITKTGTTPQTTTNTTKITNQTTLTEDLTHTMSTEASTESLNKTSPKTVVRTTTKSSASELPTTSSVEKNKFSLTTSDYMTTAQNSSTKIITETSTALTDETTIVPIPTIPHRTTTDEISANNSSLAKFSTTVIESTTNVLVPSITDSATSKEISVTTEITDAIPSTEMTVESTTISTSAVADGTTTEDKLATNINTITGPSMTTKNTTTLAVKVPEKTTKAENLTTWHQSTTSKPAKLISENSTSVVVMSTVESTPVKTSVLIEYTTRENNSNTTPESNITEALTTNADSVTTMDESTTAQQVPTTINSSISVGIVTTIKGTSIKPSGLTEYTTNQTNKALENYTTPESFTPVEESKRTKIFTTMLIDSSGTTELFTTSPRISQTTLTSGKTTNASITETTATSTEPLTTDRLSTVGAVASTTDLTTIQPISTTPKELNINVSMDSEPLIEGHHTGMIKCNYLRNNTGREPTMSWSKDKIIISNSTIPFLTTNQTCLNFSCISILTFRDINVLIEGTYACIVRETIPGVLFTGEASIEVKVKQTPALVMKPIRSSVQENASVTVNCYVSNKDEAYLKNNAKIKICFANNNTQVPACSGVNSYNVTCKLTLMTNSSLICGLGNCTYMSQSSNFTVVRKGAELCSTNGEWPTTLLGREASIPCPDGYSGTETRKCQSGGSWAKEVNTDDCKQKELENLQNILNATTEITEATVDLSLSSISNIVSKSTTGSNNAAVVHNDILQSVNLISQISLKNVSFKNPDAANKTTQVFMGVVSTLLHTGKDHVKAKNKSNEKEVTSKILSSINNFAKSVTEALRVNQSVTVQKPNMLVSIEKIPKGTDITFPKEGNKDKTTHFKLPKSALESLSDNGVSFTAVKYDNLGSEFISKTNTAIDSSVLSLTVDNLNSNNLQDNISLTFHRKNETENPPECVFLSQSHDVISAWNTSGCSVKEFTNSTVVCTCNHLTNFAILLSLPDEVDVKTLTGHLKALTLITFIGCSLSIMGALATIFIYLYFWRYLKSRRSVLVINLCLALFIAYLLFLTAVEQTSNKTGCVVIAALLHYFFLAMFCIMLALGIDLAVAVLDVFNSRSSSALLLLLSWGLPALIVGITLGATQTSGYGDESYCWLRNTSLFGFIGPALGIILANLIIVIIIMKTIYSSSFMLKKSTKEKAASGLRSICSLLPILGLTWIFGVLSIGDAAIIFQYLFAICNSLQGLFIFLFHVVLNTQVRQAVSRKIKQYESKSLSTTSTSKRNLISSKKSSKDEHTIEENIESGSTSFVIPRINTGISRRQGLFIS